jgi:hypothetical protein
MKTLRHPDIVGPRVLSQLRRTRITGHDALRDRSYPRAPRFQARQRGDWLRSMRNVLLIGRDLVFALWAVGVVAFWLAIIAGLVL